MVLAILYTLYFARSLILPLVIALFLSALLQPVVYRMNRVKIPDSVGAGIVVLLFLLLVIGGAYYLSSPAKRWIDQAPALLGQVEEKVGKLRRPLEHAKEATDRLSEMADLGEDAGKKVVVKGPSFASQAVTGASFFVTQAVIIVILVYFLLAQGRTMLARLTANFRDPGQGARLSELLLRVQRDISAYLRTYGIINTGLAIVVTAVMAALGMPTPLLWGVVAGLFNFIPYLGPAVTLGIIGLVSILSFETWGRIALPPVVYLSLTTIEGNFITPMIMGNRLAMNPFMVFISILFWGWVWGVPGVFLAVPILAAAKIVFARIDLMRPVIGIMESPP